MHAPIRHGEGKNPFVSSLREYKLNNSIGPKSRKTRGNSASPVVKTDYLASTMPTFSRKVRKEMRIVSEYQKSLDARLSKPKCRLNLHKMLLKLTNS